MNPSDKPARIAAAARDNARWCNAVCRAHGGSTHLDAAIWRNTAPSPQFYPNVITLRAGAQSIAVDAVRELGPRLGPAWAVKDSFADLDLRAVGFDPLFEASWLWRDAALAVPQEAPAEAVRWERAAVPSELAEWERAWEPWLGDGATARSDPPRFPPSLLAHGDIAFCSGRRDGRIVAGGVLSAGAEVVGLSNCFAAPADRHACWRGLLREAARRFPGLAQCGYERPPELADALAQGFEVIGPLRVWLRTRGH